MNYEQRNRIERTAVGVAAKLGRKAAEELVRSEGCQVEGLMGRYERDHFGISDFEEEFASRLEVTLERFGATARERGEVSRAAWSAWVTARNVRMRELCPSVREYGSS